MRAHEVAFILSIISTPAGASSIKPFSEIDAPTVRLSDLFTGVHATDDRILGPAPLPGKRIVVPAAQLAAIAGDYGVEWQPVSGSEQVVILRNGVSLSRADLIAVLRQALGSAGAPADADIEMMDYTPPMMPRDRKAHVEISDLQYDSTSGRFVAGLGVVEAGMPPMRQVMAGQVMAMTSAAVLTHHLTAGTVLKSADLRAARLRVSLLDGHEAAGVKSAVGMALRRDMEPNLPLLASDVGRPLLVLRGGNVRMRLESSGITLQALGVALESGGAGDLVRVMNPSSHAVVLASVEETGEVTVSPGSAPLTTARGGGLNLALAP